MKKNNKKGFTLVEVIVVLLIVGILLAITIPSIMGYVGKAKDAQIEAEARSGYVAAQTITARELAKNNALTNAQLTTKITAEAVATELGEAGYSETLKDNKATIFKAGCDFDATTKAITRCAFVTTSSSTKVVEFAAGDTTVTKVTEYSGVDLKTKNPTE